jgi:hypothetical protein
VGTQFHIETSGTKLLPANVVHNDNVWVTVSPKPGWLGGMIIRANELKIIVPGLSDAPGVWPTVDQAVQWSLQKPVYLQPRNGKFDIEMNNLRLCEELVLEHPSLRLSPQLHKLLRVR